MTRWFAYLIMALIAEALAILLAPLLPLFSQMRIGPLDNANSLGEGPRLFRCLAWFDTSDNALWGDNNFKTNNPVGYWSSAKWLLRNRAYGFKWSVLAAPMDRGRVIEGDPLINHHTGRLGTLRITMGRYWQWKRIGRIYGGLGYMINLGWLLDDASQTKALFMFSPRLVRLDAK